MSPEEVLQSSTVPEAVTTANAEALAVSPSTLEGDPPEEKKFFTATMHGLQTEAPEVYEATLRSLANSIISDMKRSQGRLKKAIRGQS